MNTGVLAIPPGDPAKSARIAELESALARLKGSDPEAEVRKAVPSAHQAGDGSIHPDVGPRLGCDWTHAAAHPFVRTSAPGEGLEGKDAH